MSKKAPSKDPVKAAKSVLDRVIKIAEKDGKKQKKQANKNTSQNKKSPK